MANRHSLGVAACTLALAVSCLAGAVPASAAPSAKFPTAISVAAAPSNTSLPSAAEVAAAKSDKNATNNMIARLEASLASSRADLQRVETAALEAQESLLTAGQERDLRSAEADKAVEQVKYAKQYLAQSRNDLGAIASDMYRNGASNSSIGILLQDDESNDIFYKAATMSALSENRSQTVNTASEAEALVTAWEEYADTAQKAAKAAATNYDEAATTATSTLNTYESSITPQKELRDELIGHLSVLKEKEEAVVRKQIAEQEEKAQEAALKEVIETPQADEPVSKDDLATAQPLAVETPQEFEALDSEDGDNSKLRTLTPKVIELEKNEPKETEKPKETEAPKETEKPKETQAPKETQKPKETEKPKETQAPKETEKPKETQAPKETQKPKAKPKPKETEKPKVMPQAPEKPKVIEAPKPKPKKVQPKAPEKPKVTPKPKPEPEVKKEEPKQESNNSNYSAAISWALKTAADPSKGYVYGANGPNVFDCSSFSKKAFAQSGINLPRSSSQQYASAPQYVSLNELRPGDLVFSSSNGGASFYHVAIYIGNGQVVHARNPGAGISTTPLSWVNNLHSKAARY